MKERPIIFSGPMVRAILEGRKTMTRRVVKPQPVFLKDASPPRWGWSYKSGHISWVDRFFPVGMNEHSPYGIHGDRLWVRETFTYTHAGLGVLYRADCVGTAADALKRLGTTWTPSIHMPRAVSRITLEISGIRVERLGEIPEEDAVAEGVIYGLGKRRHTARSAFMDLWDSINGKHPGCAWDDNPWVWVVEFQRV